MCLSAETARHVIITGGQWEAHLQQRQQEPVKVPEHEILYKLESLQRVRHRDPRPAARATTVVRQPVAVSCVKALQKVV